MGKYKKIAVVYGSDTSESEISCRSGEFVASRIDQDKYDVYQIYARFGKWRLVAYRKRNSVLVALPEGSRPEIDKTDFSVKILGEKVKFDFAYVVQHGVPGESGALEGYLEMLGIPCSTCSASVSTMAFDKYLSKSFIRDLGIVKCAPDVFVRKGSPDMEKCIEAARSLKYPVFVKPTVGGSSFGVTMVKDPSDLKAAIEFAFSEGPAAIVEQGIEGRELTCAAYFDGKKVCTLPPVEIITENEYFDYDAKYNGHSREVCPAEIPEEMAEEIARVTKTLYTTYGCNGVVRIDYIRSADGLYFLEVNTIPGMTSASLVPKMVRAAGIDMTEFLSTIIENS